MDYTEEMPFTCEYGPRFVERYELGEICEHKMVFLETKLSEWDLMHRVRRAGCEDIEEYARALMAEEEKERKQSVIRKLGLIKK